MLLPRPGNRLDLVDCLMSQVLEQVHERGLFQSGLHLAFQVPRDSGARQTLARSFEDSWEFGAKATVDATDNRDQMARAWQQRRQLAMGRNRRTTMEMATKTPAWFRLVFVLAFTVLVKPALRGTPHACIPEPGKVAENGRCLTPNLTPGPQ